MTITAAGKINLNFQLTICSRSVKITNASGGIAQLGERLNGIQEVSGSIPLISTKKHRNLCCGVSGCRKTMLQKKDNRAAGELEGAKAPLEIGLIAIKNA